jgi:hypothetical protein
MQRSDLLEFLVTDWLVQDYLAQDRLIEQLREKIVKLEDDLYREACRVVTLEEVVEAFYNHAEEPVRRDLMAEFNAVEDAVDIIEHFGWSDDSGSETESENLLTP